MGAGAKLAGAAVIAAIAVGGHSALTGGGGPTTASGNERLGMRMAAEAGWNPVERHCLNWLWTRESNWLDEAENGSGAYGIPQALPGSKMASAGADWATSAATQIKWGLGYIKSTYGSPCAAWDHEEAFGWY